MLGLPQNCRLEFLDVLINIKYGQSCFCKQTADKKPLKWAISQPNTMEQLVFGW